MYFECILNMSKGAHFRHFAKCKTTFLGSRNELEIVDGRNARLKREAEPHSLWFLAGLLPIRRQR